MNHLRRLLVLSLAILTILGISAFMRPVEAKAAPAAQTEINTDTYFYDRISPQAQWCYNFWKAFYADYYSDGSFDNYDHENMEVIQKNLFTETQLRIRFYSWDVLPENADIATLGHEFSIAESAVCADNPLYGLVTPSSLSYITESFAIDDGRTILFQIDIPIKTIMTDDVWQRAEARISQIVETVRSADRYTTLRKLTDYLITNTFYDPYLDQINYGVYDYIGLNYDAHLACRGSSYDNSCYGLLLEDIAVCGGYSFAVRLLCDALDIPCIMIGNNGHGWNLVQMDDGGWYRLDITNAARFGWDGQLPLSTEEYFEQVFLNNESLGFYDDPYMFSFEDGVRDFPEVAGGRYIYTGATTDFSYTVAESSYVPCEPTFSYLVNRGNKTCTIINYEGPESGDLVIPEKIDGYTVTAIAPFVFYYRSGFTGCLIIPDTVEYIDYAAFAGCYGLTSVKLPANLYKIGKAAFIGCKGLTTVTLPDITAVISEYAFYDCNKLNAVTFGSHIQTIGDNAFYGIGDSAVFKAPSNSAAQQYASANEIAFQVDGLLCDFQDADGKWDFDDGEHFHVCRHGSRFDFGTHGNAIGVFANCGDKCTVCHAECCWSNGAMDSVLTLVNECPAGCYGSAYTGDWQCVCGRIVQQGEWVGESTGHTFDEGVTVREPMCNSLGEIVYTCTACGEWYTVITPELGHSYQCTVVPPTCTTEGYTIYTCTACGYTFCDDYVTWLEHRWKATVIPPTCTTDGYTDYECEDCGALSPAEDYVYATGHQYGDGVITKEPNCAGSGEKVYHCAVCGFTFTEYIWPIGHNEHYTVVPPTCTTEGYTICTCSICGLVCHEDFVPPLAHTYDDYTIDKQPTCKEAGIKRYTCCVCGVTETEEIEKLTTHTWNSGVVTKQPTKEAEGIKTYTCSVCGTTKTESIPKIQTYIVVFKNWDGTVISSEKYALGEKVIAPAVPTKPADDEYTYIFTGWDKPVVDCNGAATYTATFRAKTVGEGSVTSSVYTVEDTVISKIEIGTTAEKFLGNLYEGAYLKIYAGANEISGDALIGTGMEARIMDGDTVKDSYTIIVTGDINGDGKVTVTDMLAAKAHLLQKDTLSGASAEATDTNGDNAISITDFLQLKAHILGKSTVEARSAQPAARRAVPTPKVPQRTMAADENETAIAVVPDKMVLAIPEKKSAVTL